MAALAIFTYPLCCSIVTIGSNQFNIKIHYLVFITLKINIKGTYYNLLFIILVCIYENSMA